MKKHSSKKKMARNGNEKEAKQTFAFYIGIDLGDKNSEVCVFDPNGEVSEQFRLAMKASDFQGYVVVLPRSRVALEARGQSRRAAEVIERCGHEVYVSNTRKV